ncbi:sulfurtransferase TusA family protein [Bacillus marinisedimentorum]|uniref:sulfurtransferase TusA family protein n=1 Tax=Bacillus marinisedimentorum TaxID=1821260 RepID=UPI000871F3E8|nr:sulfurtransferase TusA family protein [Bacillus marinisedimentorum]
MSEVQVTKSVDARGSYCPGPLMELIKSIKAVEVGNVVEVISNDEGSAKDIPEWANKMGHEVAFNDEVEDYWKIGVRKMR